MAEGIAWLRRSLLWGAIAFAVTLAVIIGVRLENAALTAVVGMVCGVGSSISTSLLIVALLNRRNERREDKTQQVMRQSPPVVVVTPQVLPSTRPLGTWPEEYTLPSPAQRQFSIIGEEDTTEL